MSTFIEAPVAQGETSQVWMRSGFFCRIVFEGRLWWRGGEGAVSTIQSAIWNSGFTLDPDDHYQSLESVLGVLEFIELASRVWLENRQVPSIRLIPGESVNSSHVDEVARDLLALSLRSQAFLLGTAGLGPSSSSVLEAPGLAELPPAFNEVPGVHSLADSVRLKSLSVTTESPELHVDTVVYLTVLLDGATSWRGELISVYSALCAVASGELEIASAFGRGEANAFRGVLEFLEWSGRAWLAREGTPSLRDLRLAPMPQTADDDAASIFLAARRALAAMREV